MSLQQMARDPTLANCTLAHVALRLPCGGCRNGPDEVHLTATIDGVEASTVPGHGLVWTLPLIERTPSGAKWLRRTDQGGS